MQIYNYNSLADYLHDYFWQKKKKNPAFSLQSWGKQLGINSSGAFSQMIRGQRQIPARYIRTITENLKLNEMETRYFNQLYLSERYDKTSEDKKFLDRINPLKWMSKKVTKDKDVLSHPVIFAIKTILDRDLISNPTYQKLRLLLTKDIKDNEIAESLKIAEHSKEIKKSNQRLVTMPDNIDLDVQKVHEFYLELAKKRIHSAPIDKREFNTYSFNIKKDRVPEAKERIRLFLDSFIEEFNDSEKGDDIYQIGNYFYSLLED